MYSPVHKSPAPMKNLKAFKKKKKKKKKRKKKVMMSNKEGKSSRPLLVRVWFPGSKLRVSPNARQKKVTSPNVRDEGPWACCEGV